jgi:hypothetical protein
MIVRGPGRRLVLHGSVECSVGAHGTPVSAGAPRVRRIGTKGGADRIEALLSVSMA